MSDRQRTIAEEEARRLWRRAAELQAAAERAREGQALVRTGEPGLSLEDVAAVAQSVGLDGDYVRLAHAEQQLPDAPQIRAGQPAVRWLRLIIGGDAEGLEVTRTIGAPPAVVLESVRVVFSEPMFSLVPELIIGDEPLVDGVLVYRSVKTRDSETFADALNWADARVLLVTIRASGDSTQVRVRIPLFRRRFNVGLFGTFAAMGGYGGGAAGWSVGAAILGITAPIAALAVPAAVGVAAGATLTGAGFRGLYWWATNGGRSAVLSLLNSVALRAESRHPLNASRAPVEAP